MMANLYQQFESKIREDPSAPFIELPDGEVITYGDVNARTGALATALTGLGIRPGDRVAAQIEKSADALLLYLACLRVGGVYLPLNLGYTAAEVRYFLSDAEPTIFFCRPADAVELGAICDEIGIRNILSLESIVAAARELDNEFETVRRDDDELAAILYTSGTTGRSKGAMLTHGNLRSNARTLAELWRFAKTDRLIHALPIFHTHGLFVATNVIMTAGASMILMEKFDAGDILRRMREATVLMGVPTFYTRLLSEPALTREATSNMRLFISGSAPLTAEVHRAFRKRTGHAILERYGMTETNMNTSNPYEGERVPGSVGYALPGVDVRLTDPSTGETLSSGVGMIEVRGPNVFKGYWRMPEKTAEELRPDGFFITGDLGEMDVDGRLRIVGRTKDMIISGGLNIYPSEIEAAIDEMPSVDESAVFGVPHADFGEAVVAAVVPSAGEAISEGKVIEALSGKLARFKQPKRVVPVDELPRNTMGKVQKNLLRERYARIFHDDKSPS